MDYFYGLMLTCAALWVMSVAFSVLAIFWSARGKSWQSWASIAVAIAAIVISYLGATHFRFTFRRTVNQRHWGFDSKYFFWFSIALAAGALALAICRRTRRSRRGEGEV